MGRAISRDRIRRLLSTRPAFSGVVLAVALLAIAVPLAMAGQGDEGSKAAASPSSQLGLHVIPFPNTPDASTQSQIIFSSLKPSDLNGPPVVTGSSSGLHKGHLVALPDNAGTDFVPKRPFTAGETVTVQAPLRSVQAGDRSGDPGSLSLNWSFTVAVSPPASGSSSGGGTAAATPYAPTGVGAGATPYAPSGGGAGWTPYAPAGVGAPKARAQSRPPGSSATAARSSPHQVFRSEPGLRPTAIHVSTGPAPGSKDIFVTPLPGGHRGLMILNRRGQLVWFHPTTGPHSNLESNLSVQKYLGRPVLTYEEGNWVAGHGVDVVDHIMNSSYHTIALVRAGWGYGADLHEFQLAPHGIALLDSYVPVQTDLSSVNGPTNGVIYDCVVQRIDVRTGKVLWEWHALGHVPLTASYSHVPQGIPYDYFHLNSIQQLPGHKLLISARNTWAVYLIDERTGNIIWTLGGKHSTFTMGHGARFEWQHDARLLPGDVFTVFDDADTPQEEPQSSAKMLRLDTHADTASLLHKYTHKPPLLASYEGSAQLLPNKDMFVGWGSGSAFSEYSPSGKQVFNATFALAVNTYRAYRFAWTGHPGGRPAVAVARSHGTTRVYVSWNGATQVASWRVLGGSSRHSLTPVASKSWRSFETAIPVPSQVRYLAVQALSSSGHVLGRSRTVAAP